VFSVIIYLVADALALFSLFGRLHHLSNGVPMMNGESSDDDE
jgi:hypothetical protein